MATSSLFKQFVIDSEEAAEKFIKAIEESKHNKRADSSVKYKHVTDKEEIRQLIGTTEPTADSIKK